MNPTVSIILPTYNRAKFLPEACAAIAGQAWTDWELIVVDDGSTDNTRELIPELTRGWQQPVRYIHQENQGAYGARNTGLDHATGKYIAFYDSDDLWLSHHLSDCVQALEANPDVDWVFGGCQLVDQNTNRIVAPNSLYQGSTPKAVLTLNRTSRGKLQVIQDWRFFESAVQFGHCAGLQNSVMRRKVFDGYRFDFIDRNETEDQLFVLKLIKRDGVFAYFDNIHLIYRIHTENSSAVSADSARKAKLFSLLVRGFERLPSEVSLTAPESRALRKRLSQEYFWSLGYAVFWQSGQPELAIEHFNKGIRTWPWNLGFWKTYILSRCKQRFLKNRGQITPRNPPSLRVS